MPKGTQAEVLTMHSHTGSASRIHCGDADHEPAEAVTWALNHLGLGLDYATISTE